MGQHSTKPPKAQNINFMDSLARPCRPANSCGTCCSKQGPISPTALDLTLLAFILEEIVLPPPIARRILFRSAALIRSVLRKGYQRFKILVAKLV